jgi:hypothetical protein
MQKHFRLINFSLFAADPLHNTTQLHSFGSKVWIASKRAKKLVSTAKHRPDNQRVQMEILFSAMFAVYGKFN